VARDLPLKLASADEDGRVVDDDGWRQTGVAAGRARSAGILDARLAKLVAGVGCEAKPDADFTTAQCTRVSEP
jgi:hypothetical protein